MATKKTAGRERRPTWPSVVWEDFKYTVRDRDTIDGRKVAERVRLALKSRRVDFHVKREIEVGIHMMMLCAGKNLARIVPLHIQYLYAHQLVQDFHVGQVLATPEEVDRVIAIIRASVFVQDTLSQIKGGRR